MRKTSLGLPASTGHLVALNHSRTIALLLWGTPIGQTSELASPGCHCIRRGRSHRSSGDKKAKSPNRPAMRIGSACSQQHGLFGPAADRTQVLSQCLVGDLPKGGQSHEFKTGTKTVS